MSRHFSITYPTTTSRNQSKWSKTWKNSMTRTSHWYTTPWKTAPSNWTLWSSWRTELFHTAPSLLVYTRPTLAALIWRAQPKSCPRVSSVLRTSAKTSLASQLSTPQRHVPGTMKPFWWVWWKPVTIRLPIMAGPCQLMNPAPKSVTTMRLNSQIPGKNKRVIKRNLTQLFSYI